jgi:hypothetical protein
VADRGRGGGKFRAIKLGAISKAQGLSVQTDPEGKARFRGFYGKYRVVVPHGCQTRKLELRLTRGGTAPARVVRE